MKKNRNSFFSEYNVSAYNNIPQQIIPNMYPNQVASQSSFYSGPAIDNNIMAQQFVPNQNNMNTNTYTTDIESRISKIERQINRIETRLNKLENELTTNYSTIKDNNDNMYNNNMYMV